MNKILLISLIILTSYQVYGQDFEGNCCQKKMNPFEQLAYEFDQLVIHMARNSWRDVSNLKEDQWPFASFLLQYSLQDYPKDLNFPHRSRASELVRSSNEYRSALADIKNHLDTIENQKVVQGTTNLQFQSGDLNVALHSTTLSYTAKKIEDEWQLEITISDLYDFAHHTADEIENFKIRVINNTAYADQEKGIINNYLVTFNIEENIQ